LDSETLIPLIVSVSEGSQRPRYATDPSPSRSLVPDLRWPRFSYKIIQITVSSWITDSRSLVSFIEDFIASRV